ncbi:MAG: hypothetical protein Kow00123_17320 [Anaerolineales bacterium]
MRYEMRPLPPTNSCFTCSDSMSSTGTGGSSLADEADGAAVPPAPVGAPHDVQNRVPSGNSCPQFGHFIPQASFA